MGRAGTEAGAAEAIPPAAGLLLARPRPYTSGKAGTLVAHAYGRRDWLLRRVLALSDAVCVAVALAAALALAGGARGHSWQQCMLYGAITLPAWVALFKLYGLYERDARRLSHSTLDDLPSLFHALLLGCLLLWCWYVVVGPAKLMFAAILLFGALALASVLAGRVLARAAFARVASPERVLLIGSGRMSGALIEKMRAKASRRLEPIGMLSCGLDVARVLGLPRLGELGEVDLRRVLGEQRVARVVVADAEVNGARLLRILRA